MAYKFDVFISYKNQPGLVGWMADHFQPMLETWLDNELSRPPTIFRDKVSIAAGDEWNKAIKEALAASRVVVAVLTPQYFASKWCVAEWLSMEKREKLSPITASKLLIPVKYSDGDSFPALATKRQFTPDTDFLDANFTVVPPRSSEEAALEKKVKALAKLVAGRLAIAPKFGKFAIVDPAKVTMPKLPKRNQPTP